MLHYLGMSSSVRTVTFDTRDPYALATFWVKVLDGRLGDDDHPGDPEATVTAGPIVLLFDENADDKTVKNRVHLDLEPDGPRDAEVERLLGIGATMYDDLRNPDGTGWAVLRDPEGNEFCVLRSAAERAAAS
jgi:predicted enzyme related to lactoylglutathione lyase